MCGHGLFYDFSFCSASEDTNNKSSLCRGTFQSTGREFVFATVWYIPAPNIDLFSSQVLQKKGNQRDVLVNISWRGVLKKTPPHSNDVYEARSICGVAKYVLHFCINGQIRLMWV